MLTLYYAPQSCAVASHIALETVKADYTTRRLDFRAEEQRSKDYLAINPKGRVPALVTDRGTITETPAILAYIAQTHPQANLAPLHDPYQFAQVQSFNSYLCSTVHVAHAHRVRGSRWADDPAAIAAMKLKVPNNMKDCFSLIESTMFTGPFVFGETYTISDIYLYTISTWLEGDGVDIRQFPRIADFQARLASEAPIRHVMAVQSAASN